VIAYFLSGVDPLSSRLTTGSRSNTKAFCWLDDSYIEPLSSNLFLYRLIVGLVEILAASWSLPCVVSLRFSLSSQPMDR